VPAAAVYGPAISAQLDQERARGSALTAAAQSVVRTTGTMITLFTALLALLWGRTLIPGGMSLGLVALAYALLIAAGIAAAWVGIPGRGLSAFGEISTTVLDQWLAGWSAADPDTAARIVAELQVETLKALRHHHARTRLFAQLATGGEVAGLLVLVLALASLLVRR